ncbi:MAG: hypothetical protein Q7U56_11755, partial [Humidesulfovibrio sp.]|nr:hypothetical protein [Humidesulfovibrio sp.]
TAWRDLKMSVKRLRREVEKMVEQESQRPVLPQIIMCPPQRALEEGLCADGLFCGEKFYARRPGESTEDLVARVQAANPPSRKGVGIITFGPSA